MKYKNRQVIGKPTFKMIEACIAEKGLFCDAKECYEYWEKKGWLTKSGEMVKTLESAAHVYNSIAVQRHFRETAKKSGVYKLSKAKRREIKNQVRIEKMQGTGILQGNSKSVENAGKIERQKNAFPSYEQQLHDYRWKAFRQFVFTVRGRRCERCGEKAGLQVHHPKYRVCLAWEYTCNEVMILCNECHRIEHNK